MAENENKVGEGQLQELHEYLRQLVPNEGFAISRQPDFARVEAYWHIGRIIVETEMEGQARADYGTQLIESLSVELTKKFGKGYGPTNLWWFRQFYVEFSILHAQRGELPANLRDHLRPELTWTHYRLLLTIQDKAERHFYLQAAADEGWSYRTLQKLIRSQYYHQVAKQGQTFTRQDARKVQELPANQRSRIATARQVFLSTPGWALVYRASPGLSYQQSRPDFLLYNYLWQRFVGCWLVDYSTTVLNQIMQQLQQWKTEQPEPISAPPVGIILSTTKPVLFVQLQEGVRLTEQEKKHMPTLFNQPQPPNNN